MTEKRANQVGLERLAYTPAELAQAAGLSRKAIYRAIRTGELRAARVCSGARLLVPVEAARAWFDENLVQVSQPLSASMAPLRRNGRHPLGEALKRLERSAEEAS